MVSGCSSPLTFVQYNVGVFSKEMTDSSPAVAARVSAFEPSAVSLNELDSCNARHTADQLASFASAMDSCTGVHWNYRFGRAISYCGGAYGNGIVTRDPVIDSFVFPLKLYDGSEPRCCVVVETPRYVLASVHMDYTGKECRLRQAQDVSSFIKARYGNSRKPVILCGDMNSAPDSPYIAEYLKDFTLLSSTDFTYPASSPRVCLDYIFLLKNKAHIKILDSAVIFDEDAHLLSDHLMSYITLR